MNRIYWDKDSIGIVTDHIDAEIVALFMRLCSVIRKINAIISL